MKTKNQLTIIILITGLLVSGIVYGDDPMRGGASNPTCGPGVGLGWQEKTQRTSMLVSDGIRVSTGPSVGTSGFGWTFSFSSNFTTIECCQPTNLIQSWCNFNADDPRCRN